MQLTPDNFDIEAEKVVKSLDRNNSGNFKLTTTKIRKLLSMSADIYIDVNNSPDEYLSADIKSRIKYFKVRCAYEFGRDESYGPVRDFISKAELLNQIDEAAKSKQKYITFSRYMEALVAYFKFYGGKD